MFTIVNLIIYMYTYRLHEYTDVNKLAVRITYPPRLAKSTKITDKTRENTVLAYNKPIYLQII